MCVCVVKRQTEREQRWLALSFVLCCFSERIGHIHAHHQVWKCAISTDLQREREKEKESQHSHIPVSASCLKEFTRGIQLHYSLYTRHVLQELCHISIVNTKFQDCGVLPVQYILWPLDQLHILQL